MNNTASLASSDRLWSLGLAATAAVVALSTAGLAARSSSTSPAVPVLGTVEIDYGADGHVEDVVQVPVAVIDAGRSGMVATLGPAASKR